MLSIQNFWNYTFLIVAIIAILIGALVVFINYRKSVKEQIEKDDIYNDENQFGDSVIIPKDKDTLIRSDKKVINEYNENDFLQKK